MSETGDLAGPDRDNEPDILRLRAEARALLQGSPGRPPFCIVELVAVAKRSETGLPIELHEPVRAEVQLGDGTAIEFVRDATESRDAFESRVVRGLPAVSENPLVIVLHPPPGPRNEAPLS